MGDPSATGFQGDLPGDFPGLPVTDLQINNGTTYIGVVVALCAVSTLLVVARIISRWRSTSGLAADDRVLVAAAIMGIADMALVISIVAPIIMFRPRFMSFDAIANVSPRTMVAEVASSWSVALVKTSIALLLVRLQQARAWTLFLYTIIGVQVLTAIFVTIVQTTRCIPTEAIWNPSITSKWCWSAVAFKVTITATSSLVIATDVIFALMPLKFLHQIRSSVLHRVVIAVLMGLGLVASAASVVKTVMVHRFDQSSDAAGNGLAIALWASTEAQVGITAACIPCLRAPFLRLLGRMGLYTESESPAAESPSAWSVQGLPGGRFEYSGSTPSRRRGTSDGPSISTEEPPNPSQDSTLHLSSVTAAVPDRDGWKTEMDLELKEE